MHHRQEGGENPSYGVLLPLASHVTLDSPFLHISELQLATSPERWEEVTMASSLWWCWVWVGHLAPRLVHREAPIYGTGDKRLSL